MKIVATAVKASELQAGDLFSTAGPDYWDNHKAKFSIGERVFIRTENPCPPAQADEVIYRIEIQKNLKEPGDGREGQQDP